MPEISRFYGIIIRMFYNDHAPPHPKLGLRVWEQARQTQPLDHVEPLV
ncbi:MAG: hypothetical protein ACYC26_13560 [Phycisphaerales bacterium]